MAASDTYYRVFDAWPSIAEMARDLRLPESTVRAWRARDSIPPLRWEAVEHAALTRGIKGISYRRLREIARAKSSLR